MSADKEIVLNLKSPFENLIEIADTLRRNGHLDNSTPLITTGNIWFRGEPEKYDSYLQPKIYRDNHNNHEEADLIRSFQINFPHYKAQCHSTDQWLSVMQHYGVPTRLLDWSTNLLVALYFAINNEKTFDKDGVVYMYPIRDRFSNAQYPLIPLSIQISTLAYVELYGKLALASCPNEVFNLLKSSLNDQYQLNADNQGNIKSLTIGSSEENMLNIKFHQMIEFFAPLSHNRIRHQQGVFSIHFGKYIKGRPILPSDIQEDASGFRNSVWKVIIPKQLKSILSKKLKILGIGKSTLFPEEDYFYENYCEYKNQ